ncbi:MAG TPA: hypothetical protein VG734_27000 [Lacunisphaera sp.]|nr:hypothetical protein [Lacunisphaera sp.]
MLEEPSANWYQWTKERESLEPKDVKFTFSPSVAGATGGIGLKGRLSAPAGSHFEYIEMIASCFDASGQLVEVFSFRVAPRDAMCVRPFPYTFEAGESNHLKTAPATVQVQPAYSVPCARQH